MRLIFIFALFTLSYFQEFEAKPPALEKRNPSIYLKDQTWLEVQDYLIPPNHPAKKTLDTLCSASRVFANQKSLIAAGFESAQPQVCTQVIVTRHPALPGYIIKAYLDSTPLGPERRMENIFFIKRIVGSRLTRKTIQAHSYEHLAKVPEKWLYLLPDFPSPPKKHLRRMFILVEDDMDIFDEVENQELWGSNWVSKELLDAFYIIVTEAGLADSLKPSNCPFSKDGRIAFIDTQIHSRHPDKYNKLTPFLSPSMQAYWKKLTR